MLFKKETQKVPKRVRYKKEYCDVYIGRPSFWGNPFSHNSSIAQYRVATREEAIKRYKRWLLYSDEAAPVRERLPELKGKVIGCWCRLDEACHGDILIQLANSDNDLQDSSS